MCDLQSLLRHSHREWPDRHTVIQFLLVFSVSQYLGIYIYMAAVAVKTSTWLSWLIKNLGGALGRQTLRCSACLHFYDILVSDYVSGNPQLLTSGATCTVCGKVATVGLSFKVDNNLVHVVKTIRRYTDITEPIRCVLDNGTVVLM